MKEFFDKVNPFSKGYSDSSHMKDSDKKVNRVEATEVVPGTSATTARAEAARVEDGQSQTTEVADNASLLISDSTTVESKAPPSTSEQKADNPYMSLSELQTTAGWRREQEAETNYAGMPTAEGQQAAASGHGSIPSAPQEQPKNQRPQDGVYAKVPIYGGLSDVARDQAVNDKMAGMTVDIKTKEGVVVDSFKPTKEILDAQLNTDDKRQEFNKKIDAALDEKDPRRIQAKIGKAISSACQGHETPAMKAVKSASQGFTGQVMDGSKHAAATSTPNVKAAQQSQSQGTSR